MLVEASLPGPPSTATQRTLSAPLGPLWLLLSQRAQGLSQASCESREAAPSRCRPVLDALAAIRPLISSLQAPFLTLTPNPSGYVPFLDKETEAWRGRQQSLPVLSERPERRPGWSGGQGLFTWPHCLQPAQRSHGAGASPRLWVWEEQARGLEWALCVFW